MHQPIWGSRRFWRVLTMECNTQNYWAFGLFPSSGILEARKQNVSETGSVSVLRTGGGGETPPLLGSLESDWGQHIQQSRCLPHPHQRTETDQVSETLSFVASRIPDDGQKRENQAILTFWGSYYIHFQGWRVNRAWSSLFFLLTVPPWRRRKFEPPKF
jgi:hypothetical protein